LALEQVEQAFEKSATSNRVFRRAEAKVNGIEDQRIKKLEEKLINKNEVIAELIEENVKPKKPPGTSRRSLPVKLYRPPPGTGGSKNWKSKRFSTSTTYTHLRATDA
jgi:hypothetical protein